MAGSNVKVDLVGGSTIFTNVSATLTQQAAALQLIGIENVNGTGNALANTITGNKGNNTLAGEGGNDTLTGAAGIDIYLGGDGDDTIHAESNDNLAQSFGGAGFDRIYITGSVPTGFDYAANGFEELWVNGLLVASTGTGGGSGGTGTGGDPGGGGTVGETPHGAASGTDGDDNLIGTSANDVIHALAGNDRIDGGAGADRMHGGAGNDTYIVDNTGDIVDESDGSGIDTVVSSITFSLADTAKTKGSVENLTLSGTAAINGTGNALDNTIMSNAGNNVLAGGNGIDTVSYENATAGVTVNLGQSKGQATVGAGKDTLSGFENLTGSNQGDRLTGSGGNNVLRGLDGNDTISGGGGADVLIGGLGADVLTGGDGNDRFVFQSILDGSDIIVDFKSGNDKLDLTELVDSVGLGDASYATLLANGHIIVATGIFATGLASNSSSAIDTRVYFDADGAGDGARVLIATLEDVKLTSGDFLV
jgi:Ca2+-binding RTX toxin-like protein